MKKISLLLLVIMLKQFAFAQGVKIGGNGNPDAHAILELDGGSGKGLLLPRVTTAQMNAMAAPDGMIIYNTTDGSIYLRKSAAWQVVAANNNAGGFTLPQTSSHNVDNGYVLNLTNTSVNGVNGGIKGASSTSGYGIYGSSFTGIGGYFTSTTGPSLVTGQGNVGIGTAMPGAKFHLSANNGYQHLLENTNALTAGEAVRSIFKTGNYYTGAIGTTGSSSSMARMSFLTGATTSGANMLWERMSILNNGNVGINTTTPLAKLEVYGKTLLTQGLDNAALDIKGSIMVSGPTPAAFVVTLPGPSNSEVIVIDNAACNGDPNAMLFVTPIWGTAVPYQVHYDNALQKWKIVTGGYYAVDRYNVTLKDCNNNCVTRTIGAVAEAIFVVGQKFNVLVIKK